MTNAKGLGFCLLYEFQNGETMLVRVSELLGDMRGVIDYMKVRCGGIKDIREPQSPKPPASAAAKPIPLTHEVRRDLVAVAKQLTKTATA